jgi:glycerol transport system substrate-binding protein
MVKEGLPVVNADGTPKWRMAPSPHGVYWKDGMKLGYQDVGSWTLLKSTPDDRAKAAWLYAQFVVSKTVDVKKSHVGLTFIRESTISTSLHRTRAEAGRPDRVLPLAGPRAVVADRHQHPGLSEAGAALVAGDRRCVSSGAKTPQEAMDSLCAEQEKVLERLERAGVMGDIGPKLAEEHDLAYWNAEAVKAGNLGSSRSRTRRKSRSPQLPQLASDRDERGGVRAVSLFQGKADHRQLHDDRLARRNQAEDIWQRRRERPHWRQGACHRRHQCVAHADLQHRVE